MTPDTVAEALSVKEKLGYSLGDLAANLIFQTLITFLAFFYTDVFRIPPATAATIIFVVGLLGAFVFTPFVGILADRTTSRWGKFRPWILWTSIPFGVLSLMAFSTPDLDEHGKVIYALVTYTLLILVYACNNLPYSALSGVLTGNMAQRNSMSAYRFVAVMVAQFIVQVLLLPLVLILGDGDKVEGFKATMTVFAIAGTVCFLITFFTTRERIVPSPEQKSGVLQDLGDLTRNVPWLVMLALTILVFINLALKGGMYVYYFKYYLSEPHLASFLQGVGFNGFIDGLNALLTGAGLSQFAWPKDAPTSAFKPVQRWRDHLHDPGHRRLPAAGRSLRETRRIRRRAVGVHAFPARLLSVFTHIHRAGFRQLHPAWIFLRDHDSAALGHDRRRCRLLGMEKQPARDRDHILGHAVRPQDRFEHRWRARGRHPCLLRL
jgi:hypothetical protein